MSNKIEMAVSFAINVANDDSIGYDIQRKNGDTDCSKLVIDAWEFAGVPVARYGATYTENMKQAFIKAGFEDVIKKINLSTGAGLIRGDVLLNEKHHTAIYIGNGQIVHASINELGKTTGGKPGDQTGKEVCIRSYYNKPWDCVLRLDDQQTSTPTVNWYIVSKGDTLSSIANKLGVTVSSLVALNGLTNPDLIRVGQKLIVKPTEAPSGVRVGTVKVSDYLNIRSGPGENYPIVGKYANGDKVTITQEESWGKTDKGWIKLSYINS